MLRNGLGIGPRPVIAGGGPAYLDAVMASAVFDLDATLAASYPGTGTTWANLIAAPADGSAATAYDFFTGDGVTGTTYPTHNGTPGDPAAYWGFDGGDNFRLKAGANTTFLNALHKTTGGTDWWVALTYRAGDGASRGLFNTQSSTSAAGLRLGLSSGESVNLIQRGVGDVGSGGAAVTPGTDYIIIYSYSTAGSIRYWFNTGTATQDAIAFSTTTTDASLFTIASRLSTGGFLASGERMYSFAMGNEYLDNAKAAAITAHLEARHGRDYTP